jgi:hypothetical protein
MSREERHNMDIQRKGVARVRQMKASLVQKLLLSIVALSALPGSAVLAQNITESWQGTLKVNGPNGSVDLRIVMI